MARAGAASGFCEHGLNMIAKTPLKRLVHCFNSHVHGCFSVFEGYPGFAVSDGQRDSILDLYDLWIAGDESRVCYLADELFALNFFGNQPLMGGLAVQNNF